MELPSVFFQSILATVPFSVSHVCCLSISLCQGATCQELTDCCQGNLVFSPVSRGKLGDSSGHEILPTMIISGLIRSL